MKESKMIGAFAAAGFLLSFVSGLFSGGGIFRIIGMALLFAAVFAGLGVAIVWLSKGVLNVDGGGEAADDTSDKASKLGSTIDVVIKDEELPSEENSPRFFVGNNHQMLNPSDYGQSPAQGALDPLSPSDKNKVALDAAPIASKADDSASSAAPASVVTAAPSRLASASAATAVSNSSDAAGASVTASASSSSTPEADAASAFEPMELGKEKLQSKSAPAAAIASADELEDELDEIPEFQGFATVQDDGSARNINGEMIEDSDFSQAGAPIKRKAPETGTQDAALMAKAISTVLAKDK